LTKIFKIFPLAFKSKDFRAPSFRLTTRLRAHWFESILHLGNLIQEDTINLSINLLALFFSSIYQVFQILFQVVSSTEHSKFSSPSYMSHPSHCLSVQYSCCVSRTFQVRSNTLCNFFPFFWQNCKPRAASAHNSTSLRKVLGVTQFGIYQLMHFSI
jgi:hypothetical protein